MSNDQTENTVEIVADLEPPIDLHWKRPDGTFVILHNGWPYHVIQSDPLWDRTVARAEEMGDELKMEPEPEPIVPKRVVIETVWQNATDEEAELIDGALGIAPIRLRRIFGSARHLDINSEDFPAFKDIFATAVGEERAAELLTATE